MPDRKLEIGPGEGPRLGRDWVTLDVVDRPNVDIVADLSHPPIPLPDDSFDLIYASHVIEHIPWYSTEIVLRDLLRVLSPSGILEIWVPDLAKLVEGYLYDKTRQRDSVYQSWHVARKWNSEGSRVKWFASRLLAYGPEEWRWHKAVFDREYLEDCLRGVGFVGVVELQRSRGADHGWTSLGVSARKPSLAES